MCGPADIACGGWSAHVDAEGRTYYANSLTGESQWTCPQELSLPEGWSAHQDGEGRSFYCNAATGESTWTPPGEESELPSGWSAHQDGEGRTFYANILTGESSWTLPSCLAGSKLIHEVDAAILKEFGMQRVNVAAAAADVTDQGSAASRLEERLMCLGFFKQIESFVQEHVHKFTDPSTDGSGHSFESWNLYKNYEATVSTRCEHFLASEGLTAEDVVSSMLSEEADGTHFKSSEYLMAAIDFEMFISLMLDFQTGVKDVSQLLEVFQQQADDWYAAFPAE